MLIGTNFPVAPRQVFSSAFIVKACGNSSDLLVELEDIKVFYEQSVFADSLQRKKAELQVKFP